MLFGDAHVKDPVREGGREAAQAGGVQHGGGQRNDVLTALPKLHHGFSEGVGPRGLTDADRAPRELVDLADGVEAVFLVVLGRLEAATLAGHAVDDDRAAELPGLLEVVGQRANVVTVQRAHVLDAEVGKHRLRRQHVLDASLDPVHDVVDGAAEHRDALDRALDEAQRLLVTVVGAKPGQVIGETANGGRVRAAVVVDDDDQLEVLLVGDVVECLPRHAAGERAVAHHRHDGPVLTPEAVALGHSLGPGQCRGGMGVGDPVVL